jgi:hypothetical protein
MDLQELMTGVRLRFFLARHVERTEAGAAVVTPQHALILATLALMDEYVGERMSGKEIRRLLGAGGFNNAVTALRSLELIEQDRPYRITSKGSRALATFADEILGTPEEVEAQLRKDPSYPGLMRLAKELIDENLREKFRNALETVDRPRTKLKARKILAAFTWSELLEEAKYIRNEIFSAGFHADAILTFPGPSSIFAGLVMTADGNAQKELLRVPIYIAQLTDVDAPVPSGFLEVRTHPENAKRQLKILVPSALTDDDPDRKKSIVVIDDAIITGETMAALRKYFIEYDEAEKIRFACCICYRALTLPHERAPEFNRIKSDDPEFIMPWGDAFAFTNLVP